MYGTECSHSLAQTAELRTPDNYASVNDSCTSVQGVVWQSVFNSLRYYHASMPGLPPCLGLDLFEGIVQFDLVLILKRMCKDSERNNVPKSVVF